MPPHQTPEEKQLHLDSLSLEPSNCSVRERKGWGGVGWRGEREERTDETGRQKLA